MRSSFKRFFSAALITCALVSPTLTLNAQDGRPATRPRRATAPVEWPTTSTSEPATAPEVEPEIVRLTKEPVVRIGLATGARSVTVSTTGAVLNATDAGERPLPLELARVRIEPRAYPALTPPAPDEADGVRTKSASSSGSRPEPAAAKSNAPAPVRPTKADRDSAGGVRLTSRASAPERGAALYAPGSAQPLLDL